MVWKKFAAWVLMSVALGGGWLPGSAQAVRFNLTDLGPHIRPEAINSVGIVVGQDVGVTPNTLFTYDYKTKTFTRPLSGTRSTGFSSGLFGSVTGKTWLDSGATRGFYLKGGVLQDLTRLGDVREVRNSNNFDLMVGTVMNASGQRRGFAYNGMTGYHRILEPLTGGSELWANDVNDFGVIIGAGDEVHGNKRGFLVSEHIDAFDNPQYPRLNCGVLPDGKIIYCEITPTSSFMDIEPLALNTFYLVVGAQTTAEGVEEAFRWDPGAFVTRLGKIGNDISSRAVSINNVGIAVGNSTRANGISRPFLYDAASTSLYALALSTVTTPATIYAGSSQGVVRSVDSGLSLVTLNSGYDSSIAYAVTVDSNDLNRLYLGGDGGVYRSTNRGTTWAAASTGIVAENQVVKVGSTSTTYTFKTPRVGHIVVPPGQSNVIYAAMPAAIFTTPDSNTTSGVAESVREVANAVFKSTDGGNNWVLRSGNMSNSQFSVVNKVNVLAAENTDVVYAGTETAVFKSTDGGLTWAAKTTGMVGADATTPPSVRTLLLVGDNLYAGTAFGLYRLNTKSPEETWSHLNGTGNSALSQNAVIGIVVLNGALYVVVENDGVYKSTDNGDAWTRLVLNNISGQRFRSLVGEVDSVGRAALYLATENGLFRFTDGLSNEWEVATALQDMNGLVDNLGAWDLREAIAISNTNQIVGVGYLDGVPHGYLLTPVVVDAATGALVEKLKTSDLRVTKTASSNELKPNVPVSYTISVTNLGPDDAENVAINDWLPEGLSYEIGFFECAPGWDHAAYCLIRQIKAGETKKIDIWVRPDKEDATLSNTAAAMSDGYDGNLANNISTADVKVKGCFIATAAYGSYLDPHVTTLRQFRDRWLMTNAPGRAFVAWYYEHSPPVAAYIAAHEGWRTTVRIALTPVVLAVEYPGRTVLILGLFIGAGFVLRRNRQQRGHDFNKSAHLSGT